MKKMAQSYLNALKILSIMGLIGLLYFFYSRDLLALVFVLVLLFIGMFCLQNYSNYGKGRRGEEFVTGVLAALDDDYFLMNDIKFSDGYGNIDHVVLGPNGVFVIETKNYSGEIARVECVCLGLNFSPPTHTTRGRRELKIFRHLLKAMKVKR